MAFAATPRGSPALRQAEMLTSRGRYAEALDLLNKSSPPRQEQNDVPTLLLKGSCQKALGHLHEAEQLYRSALSRSPSDASAISQLAALLKEKGDFKGAIAVYRNALQGGEPFRQAGPLKESLSVLLCDEGTRRKLRGDQQGAMSYYQEALQHNPRYAQANFNMGVVMCEAGRTQEAFQYYERAIKANPSYAEALCNLGVLYKNNGNLRIAIDLYERALKANPNFAIAQNNLCIALTDLGTQLKNEGKTLEAVGTYKRALVFNPKYSPAFYNLGVATAEMGQTDDAIVYYETALVFNPRCAEAYNNLGVIWKDKGNIDKALLCYQEALRLNPTFAQTLNNCAVIYTVLGKFEEAYTYCNRAIQVNPNYAEAYNNLGVLLRDEGLIQDAINAYSRCLQLDPNSRNAAQNRLLAMNSLPNADLDAVYREHVAWGRKFASLYRPYTDWGNSKSGNRVLKIGYLSSDFFTHSVSYFIEAPLVYKNARRFHVTCYANVARRDPKTELLQGYCDEWKNVWGLTDQAAAELIRRDGIDILVELGGHTAGNRLGIMALHPAPVQATWIGYPNTTGLPTIQYRITDDVVDPTDTKQKYSEELVRLPSFAFLCYTPIKDPPALPPAPPSSLVGIVTFGSFNNLAKLNERVLGCWASILKRVPNSRLLIKCKPLASPSVRTKLWEQFGAVGIEQHRVDLMPLLATTQEHLTAYNMVDIALDSFPYAGTTTTCEALFMGVPVVTLRPANSSHANAVGASLLSRIQGTGDLISASEEDYVATAVSLASDHKRLVEFRHTLRSRMLASPLCDGPTFVRTLEREYEKMWQRYCARSPASPPADTPHLTV